MDDIETELEALEHVFNDASAEPIKLSYGLLRSVTDNFSNEIGRGGFGVVYMGHLGNGKVAVKKLSNAHALPDKQFLGEITCLKKAKHKNIVRFLGYCSEIQGELLEFNGRDIMAEIQKKLLCFEYVPNGDIRNFLQQEKTHGDDWCARYQMIRGICQGLHCLHGNQINHLDLKPENVMLDAQMEPKITDFGLSRFLDQGTVVTQHIVGTRRYTAPEIIDKGEISFKADIYALGIIIIELLTGISIITLENWDELLDEDCPRVRRCTEIARNCTDSDKHNRPTIREVISDLDELESMIPRSSINRANPTAFPGNELLDVYPLELRFPCVPNMKMHCHVSLTNKTDGKVAWLITPGVTDRYQGELNGVLPPMTTMAITLSRGAEEELPSDTDKFEILMITQPGEDDDMEFPLDEDASMEDVIKAIHENPKLKQVHKATLTAVVVVLEDDDQALVVDTAGQEDENIDVELIDVHPTEPWVLIVKDHGNVVYIWNMQTKESIGIYKKPAVPIDKKVRPDDMLAKFIPRKQWVVIGNSGGSILVRTCPSMDQVMQFKAHQDGITSLVIHPTRPFLLSFSYPLSLKLWDWNRGWSCTGVFDVTRTVIQAMFNPKHASTFATLDDDDGLVKMWRIGLPDPIATTYRLDDYVNNKHFTNLFTYTGDQHFIAAIDGVTNCMSIWDLQKEKRVYTLYVDKTVRRIIGVICHPTSPVLVTASVDGSIHVWHSTTYRLMKTYENMPIDPTHIGFTDSRRLVIGHRKGISILDIDLE